MTEAIQKPGLASSESRTPQATINAVISMDIKKHGPASAFIPPRRGVFALRQNHASS
ncbi:MAG: winged helix-turn-helix domain-containing protein [Acidobacteria bacterium]|nr:winged helix-turn-helix domain-containing protein [Acidobacteriota bacterium]